jgi:exodeoxyribonuclease VII small subunit
MMAKEKEQTPTFEQDLERLEEIIDALEEGEQPLDDSLKLFEEGQKVLARCRTQLEKAQVRVQKLLEDGSTQEIDPQEPGR